MKILHCTNQPFSLLPPAQVYCVSKSRVVSGVVRHIDVMTCVCADCGGAHVLTGSRDTTSVLWEVASGAEAEASQAGQVRGGKEGCTCVAGVQIG